jgi:dipeptidyl aminopeptidase/acylaminoacyl peptidase
MISPANTMKTHIRFHEHRQARKDIRWSFFLIVALCATSFLAAQSPGKHFLAIDDVGRLQAIEDPRCSADSQWIAYTVTANDLKADERRSAVWMVSWDGKQDLRISYGPGSDSSPRWSPDGKYISFLSDRPDEKKSQIWLLDRRGGEAHQLTNVKEEIDDYLWSPNGTKLLLVMRETEDADKPKPILIDRFHFKQDIQGYLTAASRRHLYLFDVETQKLQPLTSDRNFDDRDPVWSPDGKKIAYISNHEKDPDQTATNDIFVMDARPEATPQKLLTAFEPNDQHLLWSPDGRLLAYLLGSGAKDFAYNQDKLAVVPLAGDTAHILTEKFDWMVSAAEFTSDSKFLTLMVADDGVQYPARIAVEGGSVERLVKEDVVITEQSRCGSNMAVTFSSDSAPPEIYALEGANLRKLTSHNDAALSQVQLGAVEEIDFQSKDGTEVHGLMVKPPNYQRGKKYPTILWIHGGPNMQDDHSLPADLYPLQLERQLLAANGYVVLAINYRGSSGRGAEFSRAIFADWGNKEIADLQAGVDDAIRKGIADPDRLGIGGWSYGGILTDYMIATDSRFKAAISGAGSANQISMYGSDQYVLQYNTEIGPPWHNLDTWMKVSYPFFHADRIKTPTLFLCGEKDFNVPITGSEQMYQALRTMGIPTQLVMYPGEFHLLTRPSFIRDRQERWLAWFGKYL